MCGTVCVTTVVKLRCCGFKDFIHVILLNLCRHNPQGRPYIVRREITHNEANSTRWHLNGKSSSLKAVRFEFYSVLLTYNICRD